MQPWYDLLIATLADTGVEHFVVSPGSRSTPLVLAIARLGLSADVLIDEGEAAFFALGRARRTGAPVALLCTSGSAGAHYLPAIIEAHAAQVPLVVVTADRPPELQDTCASQTIDQRQLYGRFVRDFVDAPLPDAHPHALAGVRRRLTQMVSRCRGPVPGPVHVNVPARKPLEPQGSAAEAELQAAVAELRARPLVCNPPALAGASEQVVSDLYRRLCAAERPLLCVGPLPVWDTESARAIATLSNRCGMPLLAEAVSGVRSHGIAPAALVQGNQWLAAGGGFPGGKAPDLIVHFGRPMVSSAVAAWLDGQDGQLLVISQHGWSDPSNRAHTMIEADVAKTAAALASKFAQPRQTNEWVENLLAHDRRCERATTAALSTRPPAIELPEHQAMAAILDALPEGTTLLLGNSLSVRTADAVWGRDRWLSVCSQRGAAGIDGLIAGAAGTASTGKGPAAVILGDVSFAHGLGGLAIARHSAQPLAIVVIDNGGGRIFDGLPIAKAEGAAEILDRFFVTAPNLNMASIAAGFSVPFAEANTVGQIREAIAQATQRPGATVIRVVVAAHSANAFAATVQASLEALP